MDPSTRVEELIARALQVPVESIKLELGFGGIPEWDSMGHMQIMMMLESEFGLQLDADSIPDLWEDNNADGTPDGWEGGEGEFAVWDFVSAAAAFSSSLSLASGDGRSFLRTARLIELVIRMSAADWSNQFLTGPASVLPKK